MPLLPLAAVETTDEPIESVEASSFTPLPLPLPVPVPVPLSTRGGFVADYSRGRFDPLKRAAEGQIDE